MMASILSPLASRELVVVTGKGGVGKSAVSAALGRHLASVGRQTLILEIDPRENVHQMLVRSIRSKVFEKLRIFI